MVIIRIKEKGEYRLYQRQRGREAYIPLYGISKGNEMIEDFRKISQAHKRFNELTEA